MSNLNIEYCCTCLKVCAEKDKFLSLGFLSSQQITYRKKLKFCVPEMGPEIEVDSYMCKPCSIALEQAYTFRCMCIRTEGMLNSFRVKCNSKDVNGGKKDLVKLLLAQNNTELSPKLSRSLNNSHSVVNMDDENSIEIIRELGSLLSESLSSTKNEIELSRLSRSKNEIDISQLSNSTNEMQALSPSGTRKKIETSTGTKKKIETLSLPNTRKRTETSSLSDTKRKIETRSLSDTKQRIETSSPSNTSKRTEASRPPDTKQSIETSSPSNTSKNTEESSLSGTKQRRETASPFKTRKKIEAETETSKINVKKRPASPVVPEAKRQCLTDDEIIMLSCRTDPGLQNVSAEELKCYVALEKLTITELPVIIPTKRVQNTLQKEFPCNKCGRVLKKKEYYYSHILKHSNIRAFRCTLCTLAYFSADALRVHRRRHHPDSFPPQAKEVKPKIEIMQKIVPKSMAKRRTIGSLQKRTKVEASKIPQKIVPKNKTELSKIEGSQDTVPLSKAESPRSDMIDQSEENEGQEVFNCLYCAYQTTSKPMFTEHVSLHTVAGKYPCPHCQKNFVPFWGLTKHVREVHSETNPTSPKKKLIKPLPIIIKSEHEPDPESLFEEPPQQPAFKEESQNLRTTDKATVSTVRKRKKYFCPQCNNEFSSRDHANIHTGERPYTCVICFKKFRSYTTLRVHRKTHTKNNGVNDISLPPVVHNCEICKQEFSNSYDATAHTCQTSTGETVYRCQICKNAYLGRNALVDHMRMHLEEND